LEEKRGGRLNLKQAGLKKLPSEHKVKKGGFWEKKKDKSLFQIPYAIFFGRNKTGNGKETKVRARRLRKIPFIKDRSFKKER